MRKPNSYKMYLLIALLFGFNGLVGASSADLDSHFIDNGDGTLHTNLMWAKCSLGQISFECTGKALLLKNWDEAKLAAETSGLAGYDDWRLPSSEELQRLKQGISNINVSTFPNTPAFVYWSAADPLDPLLYYGHTDFGKPIRLVRLTQ